MAQALNLSALVAYRIYNTLMPNDGPKTLPIALDFTAQTSYDVDLTLAEEQQRLPFVQCIYVDNSLNTEALSILVGISNQTITVPAGAQGYFPVLAPNPARFTVSLPSGAGSTSTWLQFLSCFVPPMMWQA